MMPNDSIEVVHQHQMVVVWIRLRWWRNWKKQNQMVDLPHKNSKLFLIKILTIKIIKMILTVKVIVITIIITIIIKCRGRYRMPTKANTELLVTLHNGQKPYQKELSTRTHPQMLWGLYIRLWNGLFIT